MVVSRKTALYWVGILFSFSIEGDGGPSSAGRSVWRLGPRRPSFKKNLLMLDVVPSFFFLRTVKVFFLWSAESNVSVLECPCPICSSVT